MKRLCVAVGATLVTGALTYIFSNGIHIPGIAVVAVGSALVMLFAISSAALYIGAIPKP